MHFPEYERYDATGLAELVRAGEVSPAELLEASIERIEARNPELNAVVQKLYDRARQRVASLPDGPLRGVPFLLKDLLVQLAGTATAGGTRLAREVIHQQSSVLVRRYEAAGLQLVGKTNTPELGIMGITESALYGPCRNPWDPRHTPGGSSGGSAAAVAAGMVPVAHGGDGGGSIRIPASACGLLGLKPTRGRVSLAPALGEAWSGFVQAHVLARSVRDSALLLDIADPPVPGEPYAAPHKERPWSEEVGIEPGPLRVAFTADPLFAGETHPECRAALDEAVSLLEDLGHHVVEARPEFPREELVRAYFRIVAANVARAVEVTAAAAGLKPRAADFEPATWLLATIGWGSSAPELIAARESIQRAARQVAAFFEAHDVFVTPTMARLPARIGELSLQPAERLQIALLRCVPHRRLLDLAIEQMGAGKLAWTPNTQLFNQTGQPAVSVPLYTSASGLPIGTQLVARFGGEATLFRLAAQLERARPWTLPAPSVGAVPGPHAAP